jgi:predicted Zn-dependent peptidase
VRLSFVAGPSAPPLTLALRRTSLDGGLRVIIIPIPEGVPPTYSLWIRAGSDHEEPAEAGASHLARHILLGSGESTKAVAELAASGGACDARTSRRFTTVTVHAPPGGTRAALELLDTFLRPAVPSEEAVYAARAQVAQEADAWWQGPDARTIDALRSLMIGPRRAASLFPDVGSLGKTGAQAVGAFLDRNFRSERMVLAASIPESQMKELSTLAKPRKGGADDDPAARDPEKPYALVLDPQTGNASIVAAGVVLPPMRSGQGAGAHLLARWLGREGPGTVHEYLTELNGACRSVNVVLDDEGGPALLAISAQVEPGREREAVMAMASALALSSVIAPQGPVLEHGALATSAEWMIELQNPMAAPQRLARYEIIAGGIPPEDFLTSLFDVEPGDAAAIAGGFLAPGGMGFVLAQASTQGHDAPEAIEQEIAAAAAAAAVKGTQERAARAAAECGGKDAPATATTTEGLRIASLRTAGAGAVAITGLIGAGSLHEAPGREGTAKLLSLLMTRKLAAAVSSSPGLEPEFVTSSAIYRPDRVGVHLVVPEDRWLEGLLAVRSALLRPPFGTKAFEQARQRCIALSALSQDPRTRGMRSAVGSLMGLEAGYGPDGTVASLGTLTAEGVRGFHRAALTASAVVAVAGGVDPAEACTASAVAFEPLVTDVDVQSSQLMAPGPQVQGPDAQPASVEGAGPVAWITAAWAAPGYGGEDFLPMQIVARLLDGPDGILARSIIDARGLADRIEVDTWTTDGWGIFVVQIQAPASNVGAVQQELAASIADLSASAPSKSEIESAGAQLLARRMQAMALPDTAARILALEILGGSALAGTSAEEEISGMTRNRIAEASSTWLAQVQPVITVLAH